MSEVNTNASSEEYIDNNSSFFDEIIIISNKEERIPADTDFLDATVIPFSAPENALYYILAQKENNISYSALILCEYSFDDFDAALLISILRLHPLGALFPVGVIFNSPENDFENDFIEREKNNLKALGASFFLICPYSFKSVFILTRELFIQNKEAINNYYAGLLALEKASEEKRKLFRTNWEQKINSFEKGFVRFFYTPDENADYEEIFAVGQQKYKDRLYNQATSCFKRSSAEDSPRKADSFAYLYYIQKEQGHPENGKVYLERAVGAFIENGEWEKASRGAELFAEDFPNDPNPLLFAIQKNFIHTNYGMVNNILETAKKILPAKDIADFMLQMNGSLKFPPVIQKHLEKDKELQQILFSSNIREFIPDGYEYRREQERIKAIANLEKQRLARIQGEKSAKANANADSVQTPAAEKELVASLALNINTDNADFSDDENMTNQNPEYKENTDKEQKAPELRPVEHMPTVMLEGKGSFLGDMLNIVKYTRKLYKKK